jgi:hypothetical protein
MLIPVLFRVDECLLDRIEEWRGAQRPTIPPRAEALRSLIESALGNKPDKSKDAA